MLGGDETRVLRVLRAFRSSVSDDLLVMDEAVRSGDVALVRQLTNRLAMACNLVDESPAVSLLEAVARAASGASIDPAMSQSIARAREALIESIARISAQVDAADAAALD